MIYQFRPLGIWTEGDTAPRRSRWTFKATWRDTIWLLGNELDKLDAERVVIQADVTEDDIRLDGMLRANARVGHPGIRVAFDSKYGPLTYATDSCDYWQHNVRSIALGLEALRAVDRYGVTRRGEQYTGWKQLEAFTGSGPSHLTGDMAVRQLWAIAEDTEIDPREVERFLDDPSDLALLAKKAVIAAHPDRHGGDTVLWDQVQQGKTALRLS